ncbi:hypothetical protein KCP69_04080 [Salmonella enterica subsp. enterica]|nr:hypothetical protein KCP69_04080 [Salmonella enterica subsp. enterica]
MGFGRATVSRKPATAPVTINGNGLANDNDGRAIIHHHQEAKIGSIYTDPQRHPDTVFSARPPTPKLNTPTAHRRCLPAAAFATRKQAAISRVPRRPRLETTHDYHAYIPFAYRNFTPAKPTYHPTITIPQPTPLPQRDQPSHSRLRTYCQQ